MPLTAAAVANFTPQLTFGSASAKPSLEQSEKKCFNCVCVFFSTHLSATCTRTSFIVCAVHDQWISSKM